MIIVISNLFLFRISLFENDVKHSQKEKFKLNYYEMDADKERDHLRNIIEIFLFNTFPEKDYFRNNAVRYIIRELLVNLGKFSFYFTLKKLNIIFTLSDSSLFFVSVFSNARVDLRSGFHQPAHLIDHGETRERAQRSQQQVRTRSHLRGLYQADQIVEQRGRA